MQSEQWTEGAVLEPADEEFAKSGRLRIAAVEAADIGGPPGNAAQANVQPGTDLCLERLKRTVDIARPDSRTITLAPCPGGTA